MIKIVLVSDNHGNRKVINDILNANQTADYYFHVGDSLMTSDEIKPFLSIKGNNDYGNDFEKEKIITILNHRILLTHGTGYTYSADSLAKYAKSKKCDVIFFGHTHIFFDEIHQGIRMINPGSCYFNRDFSSPSYARITINDKGEINCQRIDL